MKKIVLWISLVLGIIILAIILIGVWQEFRGFQNDSKALKESTQSLNDTSERVLIRANELRAGNSSDKSYQTVFVFDGTGAKKSEPFTITGDRFKIKYDCSGDYCGAFLYKVGSSIPEGLIINSVGAVKDETIQYGRGEYYIDANMIGSYTITVEDYK